jgi:hypothetical protein
MSVVAPEESVPDDIRFPTLVEHRNLKHRPEVPRSFARQWRAKAPEQSGNSGLSTLKSRNHLVYGGSEI